MKTIEDYEKIIKEKDNEISILKKENEELRTQINLLKKQNNIDNDIYVSHENAMDSSFEDIKKTYAHDVSELLDNNLNLKEEIKQLTEEKEMLSNMTNVFESYDLHNKDDIINVLDTYKTFINHNILLTPPKSPKIKIRGQPRKTDNKELSILDRFSITIFENIEENDKYKDKIKNNKEIKKLFDFIAAEDNYKVKYQYKIACELDKLEKELTIEDIIDFKLRHEGKSLHKDAKLRLNRKIIRCKDLYNTYGDNLSKVKFYVSHLTRMSDDEYILWKIELDKIMKALYKDSINYCEYIWKKGQNKGLKCGKIDCKMKGHNN